MGNFSFSYSDEINSLVKNLCVGDKVPRILREISDFSKSTMDHPGDGTVFVELGMKAGTEKIYRSYGGGCTFYFIGPIDSILKKLKDI